MGYGHRLVTRYSLLVPSLATHLCDEIGINVANARRCQVLIRVILETGVRGGILKRGDELVRRIELLLDDHAVIANKRCLARVARRAAGAVARLATAYIDILPGRCVAGRCFRQFECARCGSWRPRIPGCARTRSG